MGLKLPSLPSRERGLKSDYVHAVQTLIAVAPFTGAWIEIGSCKGQRSPDTVAPFTGAWIEISPPCTGPWSCRVAPFTGAWIEIRRSRAALESAWSLPSRERGLKFRSSHLSASRCSVAPFTGAWIEIAPISRTAATMMSLPSRERGLKWGLVPV